MDRYSVDFAVDLKDLNLKLDPNGLHTWHPQPVDDRLRQIRPGHQSRRSPGETEYQAGHLYRVRKDGRTTPWRGFSAKRTVLAAHRSLRRILSGGRNRLRSRSVQSRTASRASSYCLICRLSSGPRNAERVWRLRLRVDILLKSLQSTVRGSHLSPASAGFRAAIATESLH